MDKPILPSLFKFELQRSHPANICRLQQRCHALRHQNRFDVIVFEAISDHKRLVTWSMIENNHWRLQILRVNLRQQTAPNEAVANNMFIERTCPCICDDHIFRWSVVFEWLTGRSLRPLAAAQKRIESRVFSFPLVVTGTRRACSGRTCNWLNLNKKENYYKSFFKFTKYTH